MFVHGIVHIQRRELRAKLCAMLDEPRAHHLVTAKPEIVLRAHQDAQYRAVINAADVVVADGFGLILASLLRGRVVARITGMEIVGALLDLAQERRLSVHFVLKENGLSSVDDVSRIFGEDGGESAVIILVTLGSPDQEFWIAKHRDRFPNARIFVGVGGAVDYLTGRILRAPRFVQWVGFEWLWRLIQQPRRIRRIVNAVIVFPLTVLFHRDH